MKNIDIFSKIIELILTIVSVVALFSTLPAWMTAACIILEVTNRCLKWYVKRRLSRSKQTAEKPSAITESVMRE